MVVVGWKAMELLFFVGAMEGGFTPVNDEEKG